MRQTRSLGLLTTLFVTYVFAGCGSDKAGNGSVDAGGNTDASGGSGSGPGNGSGSGSGNGSGSGSDLGSDVNCTALDLGSAAEIPLTFGTDLGSAAENAATGGTFGSGDYVADVIEIDQTYSSLVSGSAAGIVELTPATATTGAARVTLAINATALGNPINQTVSGAGTYTISDGHVITISSADCSGSGNGSALPTLYYTAGSDDVTFWMTYPIDGLSIDLKVHVTE